MGELPALSREQRRQIYEEEHAARSVPPVSATAGAAVKEPLFRPSDKWIKLLGIAVVLAYLLARVFMGHDNTSHSPKTRNAGPGDVIQITADQLAASTHHGLDEIVKWSARGDADEAFRALLKDRGEILKPGTRIKILEKGLFSAKVRNLETGYEYWVVRKATDQTVAADR